MTVRNRVLPLVVCLAMLALPAFAQQNSSVTQADVQRLQDNVYLADRDISQLRGRDATRANQLGTELDKATQSQLDRGARLVELLKQPQYRPMPVEQEVMVIYAGTKGYLDDVPLNRIAEFQTAYLTYVDQPTSAHAPGPNAPR